MSIYFAPDQDCLTPLLGVINSAKQAIYVADYSFNSPQVCDALIAKHEAGVPVLMALDKSQSTGSTEKVQLAKLTAAGVDYRLLESSQHQIMHLKVVVGDQTVGFGSYNFTTNAAAQDNVLAVDDQNSAAFIAQIQKIFDQDVQLIEREENNE